MPNSPEVASMKSDCARRLLTGATDFMAKECVLMFAYRKESWSKYRTKRVILEIDDAMAEAARTGIPYQTRLDPPPRPSALLPPASQRF